MDVVKRIFEYINNLDRRWIFLCVFLAVLVPFFMPLNLPIEITPAVKGLYETVESMADSGKIVLISCDFDPAVEPELFPMVKALLRHCISKDIPVAVMTLHPAGAGIAEQAVKETAEETGAVYGQDYCFLGFGVGYGILILKIGESIKAAFPNDYYGTSTDEIPMLNGIENYDDIGLVVTISGAAYYETWIYYARAKFNATIGAGVTAVMASDAYPFLQSNQLVGLLGGLRGAAEYELLIKHKARAYTGMDSQSISHLLIIFFIILGNLAYFITGQYKRRR